MENNSCFKVFWNSVESAVDLTSIESEFLIESEFPYIEHNIESNIERNIEPNIEPNIEYPP